jgi:hypothetical protein
MKFMRCTVYYTKEEMKVSILASRNEAILEELKGDPVKNKLGQYKKTSSDHVSSIEDNIPKTTLNYQPIRRPGQPLKGLLDGYNQEDEIRHLLA